MTVETVRDMLPAKDAIWRYLEGETCPAIAVDCGCDPKTVALRLKWAGIALRPQRTPPLLEERILAMYESGTSAADVGTAFDCSEKTVLVIVRRRGGVVRPAGVNCRLLGGPRWYHHSGGLRTTDRRGKITVVARACWEAHGKTIPSSYHIYHLDSNPTNNNIGNLVCLSYAEHMRLHRAQRRGDTIAILATQAQAQEEVEE